MNYIGELQSLLNNAYAPYSNFRVAAIAVMNDGHTFKGVNVENASYGAAICAERNAINSAIADGYKKNDFKALYIMVNSSKISFPCKICCQTLVELFSEKTPIVCMNKVGEQKALTVKDLCTYTFDRSDLIWKVDL